MKTVIIDCWPVNLQAYKYSHAIVAVDVIRATTTAVTAVALGRRCFLIPSLEAIAPLAAKLINPLLAGEINGDMPVGFDMNNSPTDLQSRADIHRPILLLSTSGTRLICETKGAGDAYVACLRNYKAQAAHLAAHHSKVAVIGAGSRGEFREEDQMCCAWIAESLFEASYQPQDARTAAIVERWKGVPIQEIVNGASAKYLNDSGQWKDLEFILTHINDLNEVYRFEQDQVLREPLGSGRGAASNFRGCST